MPRWEKKTNKKGASELIPLRDRNTRVNMPMTRFREKKGTIAGGDRDGTAEIMAGLLAFYRQHGFDPVVTGSVKSFPRDLKPWEIKEVRLGNAARFRHRAGNRALDEEKRDDNYEKMLKSIENGKRKQTAKDGGKYGKRRLEEESSGFERSSPSAQKRSRMGQEVDAGLATWDQQYTGQQGVGHVQGPTLQSPNIQGPALQDHQYGGMMQGNAHHQQGGVPQTPASFNPFETQIQYPNIPTQSPSMQPYFNLDNIYSDLGTNLDPGQTGLYQAGYGDIQMPTASYPAYEPAVPHQTSLGNYDGPVYSPHQTMMQYNQIPISDAGYDIPGQMNPISYTPPTQQQVPFERANAPPERTTNTLGAGGRCLHHLPKQVLGKRGERDADEFEQGESQWNAIGMEAMGPTPIVSPTFLNGTQQQQQQVNNQSAFNSELDSPHKRRRHNETAGVQPNPHYHRHHRPESIPGLHRYGAGGAPMPLPLPHEEFIATSQPSPGSNAHPRVPQNIPEGLRRRISGIFGGGSPNENVRRGMSNASPRRSGPIQPGPNIYEAQQRLGKRGRGEEDSELNEEFYIPQQNLGAQGLNEQIYIGGQDIQMPASKRRLLPKTQGYYGSPAQAPRAQAVNKARKAQRDEHLPPPNLHIREPTSHPYSTPQNQAARPTPTNHIYTNVTPRNTSMPPQAPNRQAPYLQQMHPSSSQTEQRTPTDIREVRPTTIHEAQSLHHALQYTRDSYFALTGEEAPVTDLEDSYNVQYRVIRAAFRLWWDSEKNPRRLEQAPGLRWRRRWEGGVRDWKGWEDG